jgi:membrane-bound lytic murein transglycosylase B
MGSLKGVPSIMERTHTDKYFKHYEFRPILAAQKSPNLRQQSRNGQTLTEGFYVSLERLQKAPHGASLEFKGMSCMHHWDMMTMSDARGIARLASQKTITKSTLDAVTKDVYYVLDHIRRQRQDEQDRLRSSEASPSRNGDPAAMQRSTSLHGKIKKLVGQKDEEDIQLTRIET